MLKHSVIIFLFLFLPLFVAVAPAITAHAATAEYCRTESPGFLSFPTWYKYLSPTPTTNNGVLECKITFKFPDDIGKILLAIVEILLRIVGILAVGYVIYGGIKYIMSQGEPDKTKSAKNTIVNALIGMALAIAATAVVNLVARSLTS